MRQPGQRRRVNPPVLALSNRDLTSTADWQAALDGRDFLIPFRLDALTFTPVALSTGLLGGKPVAFTAERRRVAEVVGTTHPDQSGRWTYAYAFDSLGELEQSLAANMMAMAFAAATDGVV